jgi:hypothetical protein
MGAMSSPRVRSQARAGLCRGGADFGADRPDLVNDGEVAGEVLTGEAWVGLAPVVVGEVVDGADLAREEAVSERGGDRVDGVRMVSGLASERPKWRTFQTLRRLTRLSASPLGTVRTMAEEISERDIVYESALQLWAAAQTDFDPYQVPPTEWREGVVPVRDVDIATDAKLDLETVRARLRELDGRRLVIGYDAGALSVKAPIPEGGPL